MGDDAASYYAIPQEVLTLRGNRPMRSVKDVLHPCQQKN
jgi:hypothetical protein